MVFPFFYGNEEFLDYDYFWKDTDGNIMAW